MPFPPEYLAPPAERMKKEKKTKTPKNKKETAGKVREEKGNKMLRDYNDKLLTSHKLYLNVPFIWGGLVGSYMMVTFYAQVLGIKTCRLW